MILGRDVLRHYKIALDFDENFISTSSESIPMRPIPPNYTGPKDLAIQLYLDLTDPFLPTSIDTYSISLNSNYSAAKPTILPNDYAPADTLKVTQQCTHLSQDQQTALYNVLKDFPHVFDGVLKSYTDEEFHLDIDPSVTPHRSRAYQIPRNLIKLFKDELDRLVEIGVLSPQGRSTWISGTFIVPKKDNKVRWVSDFRALNKAIIRKVYPIPKIQDILSRRSGYKFLTKLDISMQYYTFVLDDESKALCTIATPFGLYKYNRLPMGICQSPDIAQEVMEKVLKIQLAHNPDFREILERTIRQVVEKQVSDSLNKN